MKKSLIFVPPILILAIGCSEQTSSLPEFPLKKGIIWIYSYETYDTSVSDSTQIVKATYQLTESVIDVETVSIYLVAHIKRDFKLIAAEAGWTGDMSSQPKEFWYVLNGQQVFQSYQPIDDANIKVDELILDYEFPLVVEKTWCLLPLNPKDPKEISNCEFIGKREVTNQVPNKISGGNFGKCYDMVDYVNDGNIYQTFCNSVGIVALKFDHAGSRFGFEQILTHYSAGAP